MTNYINEPISHFIYRVSNKPPLDIPTIIAGENERCALCGHSYPEMVSFKSINLTRYTNWDLHKQKDSKLFCVPCTYVLKNDDFKRKDIVASKIGIDVLQRKDPKTYQYLADIIFNEQKLNPPFVISIPSDYKKHIIMRSSINYNSHEFIIQYGEESIVVNPKIHRPVYNAVLKLRNAGASQTHILNRIYHSKVRKNVKNLDELVDIIEPYRPSPILSLILVFTNPKMLGGN